METQILGETKESQMKVAQIRIEKVRLNVICAVNSNMWLWSESHMCIGQPFLAVWPALKAFSTHKFAPHCRSFTTEDASIHASKKNLTSSQ